MSRGLGRDFRCLRRAVDKIHGALRMRSSGEDRLPLLTRRRGVRINRAVLVGKTSQHAQRAALPFLRADGSVDEYQAGLERAISNGWLIRHESGIYVKFTQAGADLFAMNHRNGMVTN
jgi:hypothetical protein